jgi:hypothetical protein
MLAQKATLAGADTAVTPKAPTMVLSIDQGEELFQAEGQEEAQPFRSLLRDLVTAEAPTLIALFTIRSDHYERLQLARELEGVRQQTLSLPPMPRGSYAEVIKGPAQRLERPPRALKIEDALVEALLTDIEAGGAKDALPLLAFTLERLYGEYGATGHLKLEHYEKLGRIEGSIEAAVEQAFRATDADPKVPKDKQARLALLRRSLIPWLAVIDPDTGAPRRRVARLSEIPTEARPLIDVLIEQRLLSTDVATGTKETTIEPAHEALLRQWGLLQGWLKEDAAFLTLLDGIKRAAWDWAANGRETSWLLHAEERLRAAERLLARPDLAANLGPTDKDYVASCRKAEHAAQARMQILISSYPNGTYDVGSGKLVIVEANRGLEKLLGERNLINKSLRDSFQTMFSYMPKWQLDKFRSEQAKLISQLLAGQYDQAFATIPIYFNNHKHLNKRAFMPVIYSFATPQAGVLRLRVVYVEVTSLIKKHQDGYYYCDYFPPNFAQ